MSLAGTVVQVAFLCCDMGETTALIPVMKELQAQNVDFRIMAMGAAINKLNSESSLKEKVIVLKEPVDTAKNRSRPLEHVCEAIMSFQPLVVMSGPASMAQEQLLCALKDSKKIVYLDNFNYTSTNPSFQTVKGVTQSAQKIICVTNTVKKFILEQHMIKECSDAKSFVDKDIKVLGRPSLESWVKLVQSVNKGEVLKKIEFTADKKTVTIIGGYGERYDNGVNAAFENATRALNTAGYQVYFQPHPNVCKETALSTVEAVGMADFIVCYDSIVGSEALFASKKVIFLQPENMASSNIAIDNGLAACVQNSEQLLKVLQCPSGDTKDPYEVLGVKKNSTEAIITYIMKKVAKAKQEQGM